MTQSQIRPNRPCRRRLSPLLIAPALPAVKGRRPKSRQCTNWKHQHDGAAGGNVCCEHNGSSPDLHRP